MTFSLQVIAKNFLMVIQRLTTRFTTSQRLIPSNILFNIQAIKSNRILISAQQLSTSPPHWRMANIPTEIPSLKLNDGTSIPMVSRFTSDQIAI